MPITKIQHTNFAALVNHFQPTNKLMKAIHPNNSQIMFAFGARTKLFLILGMLAGMISTAMATDPFIVASRTNSTPDLTPNPPYLELAVFSSSSLKSSAAGMNGARPGSRFTSSQSSIPDVLITPTLDVPGGTYLVEVTHGSAGSISPDVIMSISSPDGSCDISASTTTAFQQTKGVNGWAMACYITNHTGVTTPQLEFTYSSGMLGPTQASNRIYMDGFKFTLASNPCLGGLTNLNAIDGPLAAGQTFVKVPGVDPTATNVSVYANNVLIGSLTSGIVSNLNTVTTTTLVKGALITATQWKGGIESCHSVGGFPVGGGTSPRVRVSVSLRQDNTLTGPIGADGGTASPNIFMLGATGPASGFGTAPLGGRVINPAVGWQTVSFTNGVDSAYFWAGAGIVPVSDAFATLESLALCIDDLTDSGPFNVYIDNIMNGSTVIENFESPTNGTVAYMFSQPSLSSTTSPYLLSPAPGVISPNISVITTNNADTGSNCMQVSWQFKDTGSSDWLRLASLGSGRANPEVDLTQPISFRILVLPVGTNNSDLNIPLMPDQTKNVGDSVTFSIVPKGTGPFGYQWAFNGTSINTATLSSYTKPGLTTNDAGVYSVTVNNADSSTSTSANLTVNTNATIIPVAISITYSSGNVILNWPGSHTLQSAPFLVNGANPQFTDLPGPVLTGPYTNPVSGGTTYFRLKN